MFRKLKEKFTAAEFAWVLYDVGNSAFTMLACSLIPIWFKELAIGTGPGQMTSEAATATFALGISIVTIIVAVIGPILGAVADNKGNKKPVFTTALCIGIIGCILTGFATSWLFFLVIYIIAKIAYAASLTFYDSMLTDVTTPERMDEVSSYGFAWGYLGSCIPFLIALIFYIMDYMLHIIPGSVAKIVGCTVTAVWWFLVTIPLLKNYKQTHYVENEEGTSIGDVFVRIGHSIDNIIKRDRKVLWFLLAFFLYIDGVGTIIDNAINIGTALGLNTVGQVVVLLLTQVVAFAFALVFAELSKKYKTVTLLLVCIVGYFVVCVYAMTLHTLWQFAIMAFGVGMFQGSIQALSRSYYGKIIPPENSGEYFGIYDIFAKGASFLGSAVISAVMFAGYSINIAVGSLTVFFLLGFILLKVADKTPGRQELETSAPVEKAE